MAGTGDAHLRDGGLLRVLDLHVRFGTTQAVSGVTFDLQHGETMGVVGESGCGKSTVARAALRLVPIASGRVELHGSDITELSESTLRPLRPKFQLIAQDPIGSLNPRRSVFDIVAHGLVRGARRHENVDAIVDAMLNEVGIDPSTARTRRPHQVSGGQAQRIAIARALVMEPTVLVCDEPVSSLDVSVQAQILNLLRELRERHDLSMLFISHDLSVVRHVSDRVLVMYLGVMCEAGEIDAVFDTPAHHYTAALIASIPGADTEAAAPLRGELPSPSNPPGGCRFNTRCPAATELCRTHIPHMRKVAGHTAHAVACHHPLLPAVDA